MAKEKKEGGAKLAEKEQKTKVNNFSAVGIIYQESNPRNVFLETKTEDYPRRAFANKCLLIGGNWVGGHAKRDGGPRGTLARELKEELSLKKPEQSYRELNMLFDENRPGGYTTQPALISSNEGERMLEEIKKIISEKYIPFADFEQHIPEEVFRQKEPDYLKGDYYGMCSVWQAGLSDEEWQKLAELQKMARNLSCESITHILSLDIILRAGAQFAWGHGFMLQRFFFDREIDDAAGISLFPGMSVRYCGTPMERYGDYLKCYDVDKMP